MTERLKGWQKISIIMSVVWVVYISYAAILNYTENKNFIDATAPFCTTLKEPFVSWHDLKTNNPITVYKKGEPALSCRILEERVKLLREQFLNGEISPEVQFEYVIFIAFIVIPVVIFWYVAYWVSGWIMAGYKEGI